MIRRNALRMLAGSALASAFTLADAQPVPKPAEFPVKPIRIVVPFSAGGAADPLARALALLLAPKIGQPVIVDNRPGANTIIGALNVLSSPADGYTLLLANEAGLSLAPVLAPITKVEVRFKPEADFAGVSLLAQYGSLLTVNMDVPAKNLKEYLAYAKLSEGKLNYASVGQGSQPQIMMEMLNKQAGIRTTHVPYKGVAPAITDLVTGLVQALISAPAAPLPFVQDGRLRALAYSGERRLVELPDVPTFREAGLPEFEARGWFGLVMRSDTPASIRTWLSNEIWSVVQSAEFQNLAIHKHGYEVPAFSPAQMAGFLAEDRAKWRRTVQSVKERLN